MNLEVNFIATNLVHSFLSDVAQHHRTHQSHRSVYRFPDGLYAEWNFWLPFRFHALDDQTEISIFLSLDEL